jgi:hypothetical protein
MTGAPICSHVDSPACSRTHGVRISFETGCIREGLEGYLSVIDVDHNQFANLKFVAGRQEV